MMIYCYEGKTERNDVLVRIYAFTPEALINASERYVLPGTCTREVLQQVEIEVDLTSLAGVEAFIEDEDGLITVIIGDGRFSGTYNPMSKRMDAIKKLVGNRIGWKEVRFREKPVVSE